jgi:ATP-dependent Clp protease ATP-binding subunit ClpA
MLGELRDALQERDIVLSWTEDVPAWLVKNGYSVTYGARNLRRLIQKEIEDPAAEAVISFASAEEEKKASAVNISVAEDKIHVEVC